MNYEKKESGSPFVVAANPEQNTARVVS